MKWHVKTVLASIITCHSLKECIDFKIFVAAIN